MPAKRPALRPAHPDDLYRLPGHLIRRCHQIAVALFMEETAAYGLTPQQYASLAVLASNDGIDQITLAGLAAFNRTTAGEVIGRLEAAGLVTRSDSATDGRVKTLCITKAGRALLAQVHGAIARVQERLLVPLNAAERRQFVEYLARIASENNELSRAPLRRPSGRAPA